MKYSLFLGLLLVLSGCAGKMSAVDEIPQQKDIVYAEKEKQNNAIEESAPQKKPAAETVVTDHANKETAEEASIKTTELVAEPKPASIAEVKTEPVAEPKMKSAAEVGTVPSEAQKWQFEEVEAKPAAEVSTVPSEAQKWQFEEAKTVSVAKPKPVKKPKPKAVAAGTKKTKNKKEIIGSVEPVRIIPGDVILNARIDTGAQTTSIYAEDIQAFERDGKKWVRFRFGKADDAPVEAEDAPIIEKRVVRVVQIKRHGKKSQDRYVVKMRLILGNRSQVVEVTLADRSKFTYKVLIGRNFLRDIYIVDVGTKLSTKPKVYGK